MKTNIFLPKKIITCVYLGFLLLAGTNINAQLTGVKTIPGDYVTIAAAVSALNTSGVGSGGVTFNITSGYTETGNFTITATGTAASPIIFKKNGTGANPVVTADTGSGLDAIFKMMGTDYITFDGLSLVENPANTAGGNNEKTEYGFAFFKPNQNNGCQYNTIQNCTISLNNTYYATDNTWGAIYKAHGIFLYSAPNVITNLNQQPAPTSLESGNSYNIFSNNIIENVAVGIYTEGNRFIDNVLFSDKNNKLLNNVIRNVGGFNAPANGIQVVTASNFIISGNSITTNLLHQSGCAGIYYTPLGKTGVVIENNIIQPNAKQVGSNTYEQFGIYVFGGDNGVAAENDWKEVNIKNNTIISADANRGYSGIDITGGSPEFANIEHNIISLSSNSAAARSVGINVQTASSQTIVNVKNNTVKEHVSSAGQVYGIRSYDKTDLVYIENNKIINNNALGFEGIGLTGKTGSFIKNNLIAAGTTNTVMKFIGIIINGDGNNAFNNYVGCHAASATGGFTHTGILMSGNTTIVNKCYHNTVYLEGGGGNSKSESTALFVNAPSALCDIKNNIFVNNIQAGASGADYISAFFNPQTTATSNFLSNNNLFYAGAPSATNYIYSWGTSLSTATKYITLADYKTQVGAKDAGSVTENPPFLSLDYNHPGYLHINPSVPSIINDKGVGIAEVPVDYDGDVRSATAPDIGADELAGITLPVRFGGISAVLKGDLLTVFFSTLAEENCDHFDIQISGDGKHFVTIGTLQSKTLDGNSSNVLNYNLETRFSNYNILMGLPAILSALLLSLMGRRERFKLMLLMSVFLSITHFSCNKKSSDVLQGTSSKLFVRIAQTDKDGTVQYSKGIQVIKQ